MQLPEFHYVRPQTLAEGLTVLAEQGDKAVVMAGGTDLLVNMKFRLGVPDTVVSLAAVPELTGVTRLDNGGLRIGAGCRLTDLALNPLVAERSPALREAIVAVGSLHVRNVGTLGGNLCLDTRCWYTNQSENWRATRAGCFKTDNELCHVIKTASKCHALNASDTAPLLMALDASVLLISSAGQREVPLREFYRDDGIDHTVLAAGEIVLAVNVPTPGERAVFAKLAQREGLDFAAGTFAAAVTGSNERPDAVYMVMGSVGPEPRVLKESADIIRQSGLSDDAISAAAKAARSALGEVTNLYTPSGYKRRLVRAMISDALKRLRDQAG